MIKNVITKYGVRYDYDVTWMLHLIDTSPRAFRKLGRVGKLYQHREVIPLAAAYAAQLVAVRHEDCGTCIQLVVNMALEAKVAGDQITAVLRNDREAMTPDVALAHAYAHAVLTNADANSQRDAVCACWGVKGLVDLAVATQGVRLYPMLKDALGYSQSCQQIYVAEQRICLLAGTAA